MDEVRNPMCTNKRVRAASRRVLHGEPRHAAPSRWRDPVDQRRHPAPVDHASRREHAVPAGRVRSERARHGWRSQPAGVPDCNAADDGCQTFYYTNQQSARLMFYHDHAWGITRLNVYAGEAAGYVLTDPTEQKLFGPGGALRGHG